MAEERKIDQCDVCGGAEFLMKYRYNGLHSDIVERRDCGFVFSNPQIEKDYKNNKKYVEHHLKAEAGRRLTDRWRLSHIPTKGGRLLEIGCSIGLFLDEARHAGFDVAGLELNEDARKYAEGISDSRCLGRISSKRNSRADSMSLHCSTSLSMCHVAVSF